MERGEYRPQPFETSFDAGLPGAGKDPTGREVSSFDAFVERLAPPGGREDREEETQKYTLADETLYIKANIGHKSDYPGHHTINQADNMFRWMQGFHSMLYEMVPGDGRAETKEQLGEVIATYTTLAFDSFSPQEQTELRTAINRAEETGDIQLFDTTLPVTLKPLFSLSTEELVGRLNDQQKDLLAYILDQADLPYGVTGKSAPTRKEIHEAKRQYERDYEQWQAEVRGDQKGERAADPFFFMDRINKRFEGIGSDVEDELDGLTFKPTEEQNQMILHVKLAYGIIAHPFCETKTLAGEPSPIYQKAIEHEVAIERVYEGRNRVVLTDAERELLVKIAKAAGIPCDPERSEYFFDEIPESETLLEQYGGYTPPPVVDADQ